MGKITHFFFLAISLACFSKGNSQVSLDPSFGVNGRAIIDVTFGFDYVQNMKIQPDGKILVAGASGGELVNWTVARYNADGSRDAQFGVNGVVITQYNSSLNSLMGFELQEDGKILLTGAKLLDPNVVDYEYMLMRLNADGTPDTSFGSDGNGVVINDFCYGIAANGPNDIAIQSDQKIIVLGSVITQTNGRDFAVIRYNTDGSLDTSFGLGGIQLINFIPAANTDNGSKVVIQPDGKILVSGYSGPVPSYDLSVARLNTDGSLDNTFGVNGKVIYDLGGTDREMCLAVTDGNEIFVGGSMYYNNYENSKAIILKLETDGSVDSTFGDNGRIVIAIGDNPKEHLGNFLVQEDGKILVGGNSTQDMLVFRYTAEGIADTSFNGTGSVTVRGNLMEAVSDIALQDDGKIVLAGATYDSSFDWDFAVERFEGSELSTFTPSMQDFSLYPNPTSSSVTVSGKNLQDIQSVLIYNALSQLVLEGQSTSAIDVSSLAAGTYFLKINAGENHQTLKFCKK